MIGNVVAGVMDVKRIITVNYLVVAGGGGGGAGVAGQSNGGGGGAGGLRSSVDATGGGEHWKVVSR